MPETYTITHPKTGKLVSFDWEFDTPPTVEEQAEIIREADAGGSAEPGVVGSFVNRMIQNGAGLVDTATDLIPGVAAAKKLYAGEDTGLADLIPGKVFGDKAAAKAADLGQRFSADPSTVGKIGRAAAMVPDVLLGTPLTDMGDALGRGDVGSALADAATMGIGAKVGAKVAARVPKIGATPTPAAAAPVAAPRAINFDTVVPVERPFQASVLETLGPELQPTRTGDVTNMRAAETRAAIESSLPIERLDSYVADQLDRVGVPVERPVLQPDEAWMRALERERPTPAISHVPLVEERALLERALHGSGAAGAYQRLPWQTHRP